MRGIIWYLDKEKALKKLEEIEQYYKSIGYKKSLMGFSGLGPPEAYCLMTHEGAREKNYWIIENANNPKWNNEKYVSEFFGYHLAYIDKDIPKDFQEKVIIPMLKQSPFPAYTYY